MFGGVGFYHQFKLGYVKIKFIKGIQKEQNSVKESEAQTETVRYNE
jgi:hypothetical protein